MSKPQRLAAIVFALAVAATAAHADSLAAETGGHGDQYIDAVTAPVGDQTCTVLLSIVTAGSLAPVTEGFQLAIDPKVDIDHPASYTMGIGDNDRMTFSGGGLREVTADFKDGVLAIPDMPKYLDVEFSFGPGSGGSALIHRQCFGPQTRLVYVVDNTGTGVKGGDWLWFKGGH